MQDIQELGKLDWALFLALVLPGFISMKVYSLFSPQDHTPLKDSLLEAIAFSILNGSVMWWAIDLLINTTEFYERYGYILLIFVIAPVIWPYILNIFLMSIEKQGWILNRRKNAWDEYFMRREAGWVIVHLKDGRRIGGYFGELSYASLYPNSGHIYIEEAWEIDQVSNEFKSAVPDSRGIILRPADYHFVEIKV